MFVNRFMAISIIILSPCGASEVLKFFTINFATPFAFTQDVQCCEADNCANLGLDVFPRLAAGMFQKNLYSRFLLTIFTI